MPETYPEKGDGFIVIAIDGGAASGKSTTARGLAEALHLLHVDTGSHYRAVTAALLDQGVDLERPDAVERALQTLELTTCLDNRQARTVLNGKTYSTTALRADTVNAQVSAVAAQPAVRKFLKAYQRGQVEVARSHSFKGVVMEGRDIGSVILPDARYRFFLEADTATRQQRREKEGQQDAIAQRDAADSRRASAPLTCPEGAVRIDTGLLSPVDVVQRIVEQVRGHTADA
ncbi:MAG: (d)CMP kinase [Opitutales bacterium]